MKVPPTLLCAVETINVKHWHFLNRVEGKNLQSICALNSMAPIEVLHLEFSLVSTIIRGLVLILRWFYCLLHAKDKTQRNYVALECIAVGVKNGSFSFLSNVSYALQHFALNESDVLNMSYMQLKLYLKKLWERTP